MPFSAKELLAKMTAAIMADDSLQEIVRNYDEDTLDSFIKWLREDGLDVIIHGKKGPPKRSFLFMGSHGTHIYFHDWYKWPSVEMFEKNNVPHRKYATGDFDLRYVDDIRRGRSTTNSIRTSKYVEDLKLNDLRGPLLICLVCPDGTLDLDIPDQQNRMRFMEGLTTLVLPTLSRFGIPEGLKTDGGVKDSPARRRKKFTATLPTARFSKPPKDLTAKVYSLMYNKWMDRFILTCILLSTVSMAFNGIAASQDPVTSNTIFVFEWVVAVIFIIEAACRIVALEGFAYYWKDHWNRLDFSIVVIGLLTELPFLPNLSAFRAFRALRAARVLRSMKYAAGLRQIVDTFVETFRGVVNVLFVYTYFIFLFATLGIDVFQGVLSSKCVVPSNSNLTLHDAPFPPGHYTVATPVMYCVVNHTQSRNGSTIGISGTITNNFLYCLKKYFFCCCNNSIF